jgi:hypothetical protein
MAGSLLSSEDYVIVYGTGAADTPQDLDDLFVRGLCSECRRPLGARNDTALNYQQSGRNRAFNGCLLQTPDQRGPTIHLFSSGFLNLLAAEELAGLHMRAAVNIGRPYKELYELTGSSYHVEQVELPNGRPAARCSCGSCGWCPPPQYWEESHLPSWFAERFPKNDLSRPYTFIDAGRVHADRPPIFTVGDWRNLVSIALPAERWRALHATTTVTRRSLSGIGHSYLGLVA